MKNGQCLWRLALILVVFAAPNHLRAQTDEIQVYTGELETPGKVNLTIHSNYTPDGRTVLQRSCTQASTTCSLWDEAGCPATTIRAV